jgi:hypothetical protein
MPIGLEGYRPSLQILQALNQAQTPAHKNYANITFNKAREMMNSFQINRNFGEPAGPVGAGVSMPVGGSGSFEKFVNAIASKESGGNYGAVNRSSGAAGKYQIMPSNIGPWSREALGRSVSVSEFLRSPAIQERVARYKLQQYYNKYGAAGAAVAWYAGPGAVSRSMGSTRSQGAYPSIQAYWNDIIRRMR